MELSQCLTYEVIIEHLGKINFEKKILKPEEINLDNIILKTLKYLKYDSHNSLLDSIIYLLNNENFHFDKNIKREREEIKEELDMKSNDSNDIFDTLCDYFEINIIVSKECDKEYYLYSNNSIIDLSLPFILLYHEKDAYYPIYNDNNKIFFYHNSVVEELIENCLEKNVLNVNHDEYQFLDNINEIIDNILCENGDGNEKSIFINNENIELVENMSKMKKKELIVEILKKNKTYLESDLTKKLKKDLISILSNEI